MIFRLRRIVSVFFEYDFTHVLILIMSSNIHSDIVLPHADIDIKKAEFKSHSP